jgi:hypothetical protein
MHGVATPSIGSNVATGTSPSECSTDSNGSRPNKTRRVDIAVSGVFNARRDMRVKRVMEARTRASG